MSTQVAFRVTDEAMQAMGGHGYMMEHPVRKAWMDMRIARIGGGKDEFMRGNGRDHAGNRRHHHGPLCPGRSRRPARRGRQREEGYGIRRPPAEMEEGG